MVGKREIVFAVGGFAAALMLTGGAVWWHGQSARKPAVRAQQTVGNHMISLNQGSSDDSGGLSVSGNAADLGQLGANQSQSGQGGSSSSSSSGSASGLDPSTFAQYDKYKNDKNALFGDIKPGTGAALTSGKKATVYYKGWLTNGALIDQSPVSAGGQPQPFSFTEGAHEVIAGWEEGMYNMKAGGTRLLIIPPAAGYGSQGKGSVPPNAVLIFEVQLSSVN